jgi:hypothetical protein
MTGPELDKIAMEVFDDLSKGGTVDVEERQLIVEPVNTRRFDEKAEMKLVKSSGQIYEREPRLHARGCGKSINLLSTIIRRTLLSMRWFPALTESGGIIQ